MSEMTQDKELDALKAEIESLRAEMAGLAAGAKRTAAAQQEGPTNGEEGHGVWTDLVHNVNASRVQGVKVVRDLAAEVEHHPLMSIMAAFGIGYIIAKLWYRESRL